VSCGGTTGRNFREPEERQVMKSDLEKIIDQIVEIEIRIIKWKILGILSFVAAFILLVVAWKINNV